MATIWKRGNAKASKGIFLTARFEIAGLPFRIFGD
jgi:hypothetical protein